jgi:hypothetical protein
LRKHNPLPASGLPFVKHLFSEHLCGAKPRKVGRGASESAIDGDLKLRGRDASDYGE